MANIKIQDLATSTICGSELFNDSESFIQELKEDEFILINGGISPAFYGLAVLISMVFN